MKPKKKQAKGRKWRRRSHHALKTVNTITCPNCGAPQIPHTVCESCGFYRGENVLNKKAAVEKKLKSAPVKKKIESKNEAK